MTVITHARRKSRLGTLIDQAGGVSVMNALAQADANLAPLKPPSLEEITRQAELLGQIASSGPPENEREALEQVYLAGTSIIDAAGPFDLDDVCEIARALCDMADGAAADRAFDWRVPQVCSRSLALMLRLERDDPARAAVKAELDQLIAAKLAP